MDTSTQDPRTAQLELRTRQLKDATLAFFTENAPSIRLAVVAFMTRAAACIAGHDYDEELFEIALEDAPLTLGEVPFGAIISGVTIEEATDFEMFGRLIVTLSLFASSEDELYAATFASSVSMKPNEVTCTEVRDLNANEG